MCETSAAKKCWTPKNSMQWVVRRSHPMCMQRCKILVKWQRRRVSCPKLVRLFDVRVISCSRYDSSGKIRSLGHFNAWLSVRLMGWLICIQFHYFEPQEDITKTVSCYVILDWPQVVLFTINELIVQILLNRVLVLHLYLKKIVYSILKFCTCHGTTAALGCANF